MRLASTIAAFMLLRVHHRSSVRGMRRAAGVAASVVVLASAASAQPSHASLARRIVDCFLREHPDSVFYPSDPKSAQWTYDQGVVLYAIQQVASATHEERYEAYVRKDVDRFIQPD
jgi:rhamnogalacturonyl hydrolase YesR